MVPKEQMYQQMAMMQAGRRTDDMSGNYTLLSTDANYARVRILEFLCQ